MSTRSMSFALAGLLLLWGNPAAWSAPAAKSPKAVSRAAKSAHPKKKKTLRRKVRPTLKLAAPAVPEETKTQQAPAVARSQEPPQRESPSPLPQTSAQAKPEAPQLQETSIASLGAALREGEGSVRVAAVLPDSPGARLGLSAQDRLDFLNGSAVRSRAEAAQAWSAWDPGLRLWAVVRRGLRALPLQSPHLDEEPASQRGPQDLSAREAALKAGRLEDAARAARTAISRAPSLSVAIPARQALWIRLPAGIKTSVAAGDILEGETTMAVASDADLDFLCLPPRSLVWGKVLEASASEGTRVLRIHFFKARLSGGHVIAISARITDAAGEQALLKATAGGALVAGEPIVGDARKKKALLVDADTRLRLELDEPAMVTEPPRFYAAGPGLWIRAKETESGRQFEVTHVVPGRSAQKEGLRVGDILTAIGGRSGAKLDFADALAGLYGAPGSVVKVTLRKPDAAKPETRELKRGVFFKDGVETALPLPTDKPQTRS